MQGMAMGCRDRARCHGMGMGGQGMGMKCRSWSNCTRCRGWSSHRTFHRVWSIHGGYCRRWKIHFTVIRSIGILFPLRMWNSVEQRSIGIVQAPACCSDLCLFRTARMTADLFQIFY